MISHNILKNVRYVYIKIWLRNDFDRLINHVHAKGFEEFITIKECLDI